MELKKNPKADLTKRSGLYFAIGLALILGLTYLGMEWKTYDKVNDFVHTIQVDDDLTEDIPITEQLNTPPPPPAPEVIEVVEDEAEVEEKVIQSTEVQKEEKIVKVDDIKEVEEVIDVDVPFAVIEDKPMFPGCENVSKDKQFDCFKSKLVITFVKPSVILK